VQPDCRLLVAIPLDRAAFLARGRADGQSFAGLFRAARPGFSDWALWEAYEPLASQALSVMSEARAHGITVVDRPVLADFHAAARSAAVVTLVAHWRTAEFLPGDIGDVEQLAGAWHRVCEDQIDRPRDVEMAARRLNLVPIDVRGGRTRALARARQLVAREYALFERRSLLQLVLPGVVSGGPAVEFADRFVPVSEIVAGIGTESACLFDLTICNSVLLGEEIRRRCRHAVVIMNADAAAPDVRLAVYRQVVRLMVKRQWSYQDATMRLRSYLTEGVQ